MNIVPKQGGNTYSGSFFTSYAGEGWQGTNLTDEHIAAGLRVAAETLKLWDVNGSLGGPIMRDKLWFYWTGRHQGTRQLVAGLWANNNAGDPTKWTYDPDFSRQAERRWHLEELEHSLHVPGDAAQQDRHLVGRAGELPVVHQQRRLRRAVGDVCGHVTGS